MLANHGVAVALDPVPNNHVTFDFNCAAFDEEFNRLELIMPRIDTKTESTVLSKLSDIREMIATRFGEVGTSIATIETNQDSFKSSVVSLTQSVQDLTREISSRPTKQDIMDLSARTARDISDIQKDKVSRAEVNKTDSLIGDLIGRVDDLTEKVDQVGRIEKAVQTNQLRLDKFEIEMAPLRSFGDTVAQSQRAEIVELKKQVEDLKSAKQQITGWQQALRWAWGPLLMCLTYFITKLFHL